MRKIGVGFPYRRVINLQYDLKHWYAFMRRMTRLGTPMKSRKPSSVVEAMRLFRG